MTAPSKRSLGITVMPDYAQSEGVDAVLENIVERLGCDVICTMPSVAERCSERLGVREPPADAGAGLARTLDRPLWGDTALWMRTAPSFVPNASFYRDAPYAPPEPDALTRREGHIVADMLAKAKRAGLSAQLQVMAAAPPALRVQQRPDAGADEPLTVFGTPVRGRVDANVSLASKGLRAYMRALVADLLANYPDCDALRFDWPEYPPYALDSLLFDFSPPAVKRGQELGHDVEAIRARALEGLRKTRTDMAGKAATIDALLRPGGWAADLLAFRSAIVTDYVGALTTIVKEASYGRVGVVMQAFPPPLNRLSGVDFAAMDGIADEIAVKHYTMHWPMIERGYVERLAAVTGLDADSVFATVHHWLGLNGGAETREALRYPEPHEPHPADDAALRRTVEIAAGQINHSRLSVITHGYGPLDDVERRFRAVLEAPCRHLHINRYGYLSDAKIARLGAIWRETA
ncbi:conserved hypothetical protein [Bosea sp. 62]|uniref:hypothetical protein n=1 Tax=unclassified Bosea (in: a-proteobacteria) TaxID=2653178 RepID=UPI001256F22C|nr:MULTISPECIES: hypothetical protein [unclassified Bosea (in: a-proteobacteria)]CAD5291674.1 conserved hypothetical protein [Bosea sp. 7B]CAD5299549.1 conserved hypothetical protein [Bosea sp. 21B]CAD5299687.1 conserved hypothetical protein [Bosea sp. 46]VVT61711.1 conserved hypothetical protein [Bosea sp. EC-HK365B]VXB04824.1 conserved hypothetical protein [Bosea sp. 127]